jgi:uncharacterized protein YycO
MKKLLITLTFLFIHVACSEPKSYDFKNGDIIFQDSPSSQSQAIKLATHSDYSHVGIVYRENKKLYVYEAVDPVVLTPLNSWIENGVGSKFVVKRLKDETLLTEKSLKAMKRVMHTFAKKPYDALFGWNDDRIYCSELVWKIYKRGLGLEVGKLKRVKDFDLTHPVVKEKLKERYGNNIPLNEKVIDPQGVFDSDLLTTVYMAM